MSRSDRYAFSRRGFIAAVLAGIAAPAGARAPLTSKRPPARGVVASAVPAAPKTLASGDLVAKAGIKGQVVFALADANTGEMLDGMSAAVGTAPASVAKSITALYALDVLGPDHQFSTRVFAPGGMVNGVVKGDLVLVGGGDPTLDTRDLADLASALKDAGLREVQGRFLVYEGLLSTTHAIDPEQPDHVGYSPAVSGIALNYNRVHFQWKREAKKYAITMDARAGKYRPEVQTALMEVSDRNGPVFTYEGRENRDYWSVSRRALGNEGARWLPVRHPGLYAGDVFGTLMRSHGVALKSAVIADVVPLGTSLAEVKSAPLREILQGMLKFSTNLTAEMVGSAATLERIGKVPTLAASAAEMNVWAKATLGMRAPAFADHSGLGGASRVSAQDMVTGLAAVHRDDVLRPILKPVLLRDGEGRPIDNHPIKIAAKTGTLNYVSGLAGYIVVPEGPDLVFAIFASNEEIRATIPRAERERPRGARTWATRARRLQAQLLSHWADVLG